MATPIPIGATKVKVASVVQNRALIRLQNVGKKAVYIKKIPLGQVTTSISDMDYEVKLNADPGESGKGDSFETNSINGFVAISVNQGSELAIYQTFYI
jgi:hypothetical protein